MRFVRVISYLRIGGVEKRMFYVLKGIKDYSVFDPSVIVIHSKGKLASMFENAKIPVQLIRFKSRFDPIALVKMVCYLKKFNISFIHAHMYRPGVSSTVAALIAGIPIIYNVHNLDQWDNRRQILVDKFLNRFRSKIVCVSYAVLRDYILKTKCNANKISVVYNGTMIPEKVSRNNYSCPVSGDVNILCVSRFVPHKRIDRVLYFFELLSKKVDCVRLIIVGGGPLLRVYKDKYGYNNSITFTGEVIDVDRYYLLSDFFILMSDKEGLSNSIIESMSYGCVPLVSNVGGNCEIVENGKCGIVENNIYKAVEKVSKLMFYPKLFLKKSISARSRVSRKFNINKMVRDTLILYGKICQLT